MGTHLTTAFIFDLKSGDDILKVQENNLRPERVRIVFSLLWFSQKQKERDYGGEDMRPKTKKSEKCQK